MKTNIKLTKLSDNPNALRTNEVTGYFYNKPMIGEVFLMYAKPIDPNAAIRVVATSIIQGVEYKESENITIIQTMNSTYKIEYLEE